MSDKIPSEAMNDIFIFDVALLFKSDLNRGKTPELPLQYLVLVH